MEARFATTLPRPTTVPGWLPVEVVHYLSHTELGRSMRDIARSSGRHASTISRQIRRYENRRDDPLVDQALARLGSRPFLKSLCQTKNEETHEMTATLQSQFKTSSEVDMARDTKRVLRRLAEAGAVLAVAQEMEKAVVVRDLPGGKTARTAVVDREVAEVMALNEWISTGSPGRIARYTITGLGRSALKRMLSDEQAGGMAENVSAFAAQHGDLEDREFSDGSGGRTRRSKVNTSESPLSTLARRRDKDGKPFLSDELVVAGERLREDFELAQMGPRVTQNWEGFLTAGVHSGSKGVADGPRAARDRVSAALSDLGPGLGDVALRCCCFLEGIEAAEREMGWSARSGKIVLRIALQRLKRHYEETTGKFGPMIG